jgi:hypothetical protein
MNAQIGPIRTSHNNCGLIEFQFGTIAGENNMLSKDHSATKMAIAVAPASRVSPEKRVYLPRRLYVSLYGSPERLCGVHQDRITCLLLE